MIVGHPKKLFLSSLIIFEQGRHANFHDLYLAGFYHNEIFNSQSLMNTLSYMKYIGDIQMILFDEHFMDVEHSFLLRLNLTCMLSSYAFYHEHFGGHWQKVSATNLVQCSTC